MTEQELTNEITRWNVYGGAWDIVRMVRHITILHDEVHALTAERDALKAQLEELQELLNDAEVDAEGRSHDG